jgi:hypothetical protein
MISKRLGLLLAIAIAFLGFCLSGGLMAAQNDGTLRGVLLDPQGSAIADAEIHLRWNDANGEVCWNAPHCPKTKKPQKRSLSVRTEMDGEFSVRLPPGNWDVLAYRDGFAPVCTVVSVEAGKPTTIELRFPRYVVTSIQ